MKTYCMNDIVYYKLTDKGKEILEKHNRYMKGRWPQFNWQIDYLDGGWLKSTLWILFERYGPHSRAGSDCLISDLTFENPLDAENKEVKNEHRH